METFLILLLGLPFFFGYWNGIGIIWGFATKNQKLFHFLSLWGYTVTALLFLYFAYVKFPMVKPYELLQMLGIVVCSKWAFYPSTINLMIKRALLYVGKTAKFDRFLRGIFDPPFSTETKLGKTLNKLIYGLSGLCRKTYKFSKFIAIIITSLLFCSLYF